MKSDSSELDLVREYCAILPGELNKMLDLLEGLEPLSQTNSPNFQTLQQEAHRNKGTASCMGFPELGAMFGELEKEMESMSGFPTVTTQRLNRLARCLGTVAQGVKQTNPEESLLLTGDESDLKFDDMDEDGRPETEAEDVVFKDLKIVFADDDSMVRALMRSILKSLGVRRVSLASNGQELLETACLMQPDIIITDWHMTPLTGLDVLEAVRNGMGGVSPDTKLIFVTSENTTLGVKRAMRSNVDYYIVKPFSHQAVARAIRLVVQQKSKAA